MIYATLLSLIAGAVLSTAPDDAELLRREMAEGRTLVVSARSSNFVSRTFVAEVRDADDAASVVWSLPAARPVDGGDWRAIRLEVLDALIDDDTFVIMLRSGVDIWVFRRDLNFFGSFVAGPGDAYRVEEATLLPPEWNSFSLADIAGKSEVEGSISQKDDGRWSVEIRQVFRAAEGRFHDSVFVQSDGKWEFASPAE